MGGCDWEIGNIAFSNFHFRKENVHVALGKPGDASGDLVRVNAWGISAHFYELKVDVKQTGFPFMSTAGIADAKASGMSVSLAFRLQLEPQSATEGERANE